MGGQSRCNMRAACNATTMSLLSAEAGREQAIRGIRPRIGCPSPPLPKRPQTLHRRWLCAPATAAPQLDCAVCAPPPAQTCCQSASWPAALRPREGEPRRRHQREQASPAAAIRSIRSHRATTSANQRVEVLLKQGLLIEPQRLDPVIHPTKSGVSNAWCGNDNLP